MAVEQHTASQGNQTGGKDKRKHKRMPIRTHVFVSGENLIAVGCVLTHRLTVLLLVVRQDAPY